MESENPVFVTHTCRNKKCRAGFLDTDDNNAQNFPPTTKYCPECRAQGFEKVKDIRGANGAESLKRYREAKKASGA